MANYLDYLSNNGGNKGGNNMMLYILVCMCVMCISFSVAGFLIYKYGGENFVAHNEQRTWG